MKKISTILVAGALGVLVIGAGIYFRQPVAAEAAPTIAEAKKGWLDDYAAAREKAKAEGKLVLMDFTGSDWCPACIQLNREVFSTFKFAEYAQKHFVLMEVDFPAGKDVPEKLQRQNLALKEKYLAEDAFPTLVVITPEEKKLGQILGYQSADGADGVIRALDEIVKKAR